MLIYNGDSAFKWVTIFSIDSELTLFDRRCVTMGMLINRYRYNAQVIGLCSENDNISTLGLALVAQLLSVYV